MKLSRENTEIRNQSHEMWAEGMEDFEPSKTEIKSFLLSLGYISHVTDIFYDDMQKVYRWNADISNIIS